MMGKDAVTVESLVRRFNQTERTILALYYCEELTPAEIGQVLDIAELEVVETIADIRQRTASALGETTHATVA